MNTSKLIVPLIFFMIMLLAFALVSFVNYGLTLISGPQPSESYTVYKSSGSDFLVHPITEEICAASNGATLTIHEREGKQLLVTVAGNKSDSAFKPCPEGELFLTHTFSVQFYERNESRDVKEKQNIAIMLERLNQQAKEAN